MAKNEKRTYGRNRSKSNEFFNRQGAEKKYEADGVFFLKLVIFVVLSALWLRLKQPITLMGGLELQAVPIGLIMALVLVLLVEKYQFNRKIWYVTLIIMAILSSFTPVGIII